MTAPWLQTRDGNKWNLLQPRAENVVWPEVAHALSNLCRFTGHTSQFYSVAEHSVRVMEMAQLMTDNKKAHLLALLHDAHEFVLGDMATPLQHAITRMLPDFAFAWRGMKEGTDRAIFAAAGLGPQDVQDWSNLVHHADMAVLMREREAIVGLPPEPWDAKLEAIPPAPVQIKGLLPRAGRNLFLRKLAELGVSNVA